MARVFDAPIITNDQNIDRLLAVPLPVLILFWKDIIPEQVNQSMKQLAAREAGQLIVAKVYTRDNPGVARRFQIHHSLVLVGLRAGVEITRANLPDSSAIEAHAAYLLGRAAQPAPSTTSYANRNAHVHTGTDSRPVSVTDALFEQTVLHSSLPVLVDFWAPWCGPCLAIAPILDRIARHYAGQLRVAKVNVDQNPYYAGLYGVQGIPTLLLVKDGKVVDRVVGALPEPHLRSLVERFLQGQAG